MNIPSIAALALSVLASSAIAGEGAQRKCGAGSCSKKGAAAQKVADTADSRTDASCSKKEAASKEASCAKKEAAAGTGTGPAAGKEASCSKKEAARDASCSKK